jgi:hypothetical protein
LERAAGKTKNGKSIAANQLEFSAGFQEAITLKILCCL